MAWIVPSEVVRRDEQRRGTSCFTLIDEKDTSESVCGTRLRVNAKPTLYQKRETRATVRHFFSLISSNRVNTAVSDRFTVRNLLTVELCVQEGFRVSRTPFTDDDRWGRNRMSHHSGKRGSVRDVLCDTVHHSSG